MISALRLEVIPFFQSLVVKDSLDLGVFNDFGLNLEMDSASCVFFYNSIENSEEKQDLLHVFNGTDLVLKVSKDSKSFSGLWGPVSSNFSSETSEVLHEWRMVLISVRTLASSTVELFFSVLKSGEPESESLTLSYSSTFIALSPNFRVELPKNTKKILISGLMFLSFTSTFNDLLPFEVLPKFQVNDFERFALGLRSFANYSQANETKSLDSTSYLMSFENQEFLVVNSRNDSCSFNVCVEVSTSESNENVLNSNAWETQKVFDIGTWKPACFPSFSQVSNESLVVFEDSLNFGRRYLVKMMKQKDRYFSSFDEKKMFFMKFGVNKKNLKAVKGQKFNAFVEMDFWLWSQGLIVLPGNCSSTCVDIQENKIIIEDPSNSVYSFVISVFGQNYLHEFQLSLINSSEFSLNLEIEAFYEISNKVFMIDFEDLEYPEAEMHACRSNHGIISINDSIYLYLPVTSRFTLEVICNNSGGSEFSLQKQIFTNKDSYIEASEFFKAWVGFLFYAELQVNDEDGDQILVTSEIWQVNGSSIYATFNESGKTCGNVSVHDGFSKVSYEICVEIETPPAVFNINEECLVENLCFFDRSSITESLKVANHSVSSSFLYWIPEIKGSFEFELVLKSSYTEISSKLSSNIEEKLKFILIPSTFGICGDSFEFNLSSINFNPPFNYTSNQNLSIIDEVLQGKIEEINFFLIKSKKSKNFAFLIFTFLCDFPEVQQNISISAVYSKPVKYFLPSLLYSEYFSNDPEIRVDEVNGIFYWDFPTEVKTFELYTKDPRFTEQFFYLNVLTSRPVPVIEMSQEFLAFFSMQERSLRVNFTASSEAIIDYDTDYFFGDIYEDYVILKINSTEAILNTLSYFTVIEPKTENFESSQATFLFIFSVFEFVAPVLEDISFYCVVGKSYSIDLRNFIIHLYPSYLPLTIYFNSNLLESWELILTPTTPEFYFTLKACFNQMCSNRDYLISCVFPLTFSLMSSEIYADVESFLTVQVFQNGKLLDYSDINSLWIEGRLLGMKLLKTGVIVWTPSQVFSGKFWKFRICSEIKDYPDISYSQEFEVEVLPHILPDVLSKRVEDDDLFCVILFDQPDKDCYMVKEVQDFFGYSNVTYEIYNPKNGVIIENKRIVWRREGISDDFLHVSASVILKVTDEVGGVSFTFPFHFRPNYLAEISEITSINGENNLIAFEKCSWARSFQVIDGNLTYPEQKFGTLKVKTSDNSQISENNGIISWLPEVFNKNITIFIEFTDDDGLSVTAEYEVYVRADTLPSCNYSASDLMLWELEMFSLDLKEFCSDEDGDSVLFQLLEGPEGMKLDGSRILWQSSEDDIGVKYQVRVKITNQFGSCPVEVDFEVVPQPVLDFSLETTEIIYRKPIYIGLNVMNMKYFQIEMFSFILMSDVSSIQIDSQFGIIFWGDPDQDVNISVTVNLKSGFYSSDQKIKNFELKIIRSSIFPYFDQDPVIALNNRNASAGLEWSINIQCLSPIIPAFLSLASSQMSKIGTVISFLPSENDSSSRLSRLTCSNLFNEIFYYFIVAPIDSLDPPGKCEDIESQMIYREPFSTQLSFDWILRDHPLSSLSFSGDLSSFPGLKLFKHGFLYSNSTQRPLSTKQSLFLSHGLKISNCSLTLNFINSTDPPIFSSDSSHVCNFSSSDPCTFKVTYKGDDSNLTVSPFSNIQTESSTITWTPPDNILYQKFQLSLENEAGSENQDFLFCQHSNCAKWPAIESMNSSTCPGDLVLCEVFWPGTLKILEINGRNFGNYGKVIIGNKECKVVEYSSQRILCQVPHPSYFLKEYLVEVIRGDLDMASPAKRIHYKQLESLEINLKPFPVQPFIVTEDSDGFFLLPISADLLFPSCTCEVEEETGKFIFQSKINGICKFFALTAKTHLLTFCCYSNCYNLTFNSVSNVSLEFISQDSISSHGYSSISLNFSLIGDCESGLVLLKAGPYYYKPSNSCSFAALQISPQPLTFDFLSIQLSLNQGHSFHPFKLTLKLKGLCNPGEYLSSGLCKACPAGHFCEFFAFSPEDYLFTANPCEIGWYNPTENSTTCLKCPKGSQCFCRGLTEHFLCDAGFVCDEEGLVKRWKPCPSGRVCLAGTSSSQDDSGGPELCPEDNYCFNGVFTLTVDEDNPYAPRPCEATVICPAGSTNPLGVIDCSIGYFCVTFTVTQFDDDIFQDPSQCAVRKCLCSKGYYCPSDQLSNPIICPKGKFQPEFGSDSCRDCPVGFYCPWSLEASPKQAVECEAGFKCLGNMPDHIECPLGEAQNRTGQENCEKCLKGTYQNELGQSECKVSIEGYYCPDVGMSSMKICPERYYCSLTGINEYERPVDKSLPEVFPEDLNEDLMVKFPQQCPAGYYCPSKTSFPIPCPIGSFQGSQGEAACIRCPPGRLCLNISTVTPSKCPSGNFCVNNKMNPCPAGYFCLENTETQDPLDSSEFKPLPCLKGTFCTGGNTDSKPNLGVATSAQNCSEGFFNDKEAQIQCRECPAGFECLDVGMVSPTLCKPGRYRNFDITIKECVECPEGTFLPDYGGKSISDCLNCSAGIVCNVSGSNTENNSYPCPAGYFCIPGTSRDTRNNNPCPAGFYCLPGTKSEEESLLHKCPPGRYCASATAVEKDEECLSPNNCSIGSICETNNYCPSHTPEMIACPSGYTSIAGSFSIDNCTRTSPTFYKSQVIRTVKATDWMELTPLAYHLFDLNFLKEIQNASIPHDYQLLITFDFGNKRSLLSKKVENLLVSNSSYGTKLSVPMLYSSKSILLDSPDVKLSVQVFYEAKVLFEFQLLNSSYENLFGWKDFQVPLVSVKELKISEVNSGLYCVLTEKIGEIVEDPVNLYKTIFIDEENSPLDQNPSFEYRYSMSLVLKETNITETLPTPKQNTSSIWESTNSTSLVLDYLPYITNCYPDFGANLPINQLINNDKCVKVKSPNYVNVLNMFQKVRGDSCSYKLTCDYSLDINNYKRLLRWYEAYTEEHNSRDSSKLQVPVFYLSRNFQSSEKISEIIGFQNKVPSQLIPVQSEIVMDKRSWKIGDVPKSVSLSIQYFEKKGKTKEIIKAKMVFSDVKNSESFDNTFYSFSFEYKSLDWFSSFNLNAFSFQDYCFVLFIYSSFLIAFVFSLALANFLICPVRVKLNFVTFLLKQFLNSIFGFLLAFLPVFTAITSVWLVIYYSACLDYEVGNYNDTVPINDSSSERALLYRTGRFGTSLFVIGIACISWSVDLAVPIPFVKGFGFENEKNQQNAQGENPVNQGPLLLWILICLGLNIMLDTIGQLPLFSDNFYIIVPALFSLDLIFNQLCLIFIKDFFYSVFFKIGLKIGFCWMVLNSRNLLSAIGSFVLLYLFRVFYSGFLEELYQRYVLNWVLKLFRKMEFLYENLTPHQIQMANSISEINEQSVSLIISYFYPIATLGIYFYYENASFRLIQSHFLVLFIFTIYFLAFEPLTLISINLIRSSRFNSYSIPSVYSSIMSIYRKKHTIWALCIIKYDSEAKITKQIENQCKVAWSSQYFLMISLFSLGVFCIIFGIKLWQYASYAPYLDLWMSVIAILTYAGCFVIMSVCKVIGSKVIYKVNSLNQLFQRGLDGKVISNIDDHIRNSALKKEVDRLMNNNEDFSFSAGEITDNIIRLIKNGSNRKIIIMKLCKVFYDIQLNRFVDFEQFFEGIKNINDLLSVGRIEEKIGMAIDPVIKVGLVNDKRIKERRTFPKYPNELLYDWEKS